MREARVKGIYHLIGALSEVPADDVVFPFLFSDSGIARETCRFFSVSASASNGLLIIALLLLHLLAIKNRPA